jgi:hypothetical protein
VTSTKVGLGAMPVGGDMRGTRLVNGPTRDVVAMEIASSSKVKAARGE